MALDGLTLGFVARELHDKLAGGRVDRVQQPEKDMVVLMIRSGGQNHRLLINANPTGTRLHLTDKAYESLPEAPVFCMLMRKHLVSGRILGVSQLHGDRLLRIDISAYDDLGELREKQLYFEAMGRHSNLSLVQDGMIVDCLRHVTDDMSRVRRMLPGAPFEMPPAQDKVSPDQAEPGALCARLAAEGGRADRALAATVSGLAAASAREICLRLAGQEQPQLKDLNLNAFCDALAGLLRGLPAMADPRLYTDDTGLPREALPFAFLSLPREHQQPQGSLSQALDTLYYERDRRDRLTQRTSAFRRSLKTAEERTLKKLAIQEEEIAQAGRMEEHRVAGELLTAYAHLVGKGATEAVLPNYYDGGELTVVLDPALSPAQNAQRYFKKYRKAAVARRTAAQQRENTLHELALLGDALYALEQADTMQDIAQIKEPLRDAGLIRREAKARQKKQEKPGQPLRYQTNDGFEVWVGKNSVQNEQLLKSAQGTDLWLHAKDMPGSHVIISLQGREVTDAALMDAARLAAWYSRGQGQGVPVNYTLRKYVKKPAGAPAGFVTFTGEKMLLVTVSEAEIRAMRRAG